MFDRRTFLSMLAGAAVVPNTSSAQPAARKTALYASVGPQLAHYDIDVDGATLARRGTVTLPANVQYAWPHASRRCLYVATSSSASGAGPAGTVHHVSAFRIDAATRALTPHGNSIPLPTRPIHVTTDMPSEHLLVAFNCPSALRVYRINRDATLGEELRQPGQLDAGIYAHQIRVSPDNKLALLVTRGNRAEGGKPEEPGALKVFNYRGGRLTKEVSIAPNGGYGFGPRHLDFHPSQPWVYVSLETQNKLDLFGLEGGRLSDVPVFTKDSLAQPGKGPSRQAAGTVHMHPGGRFVYQANRADDTADVNGRPVFVGGENSLVVYSINAATGEPTPIQHIDTRGIHCRTFHIDPSGRMLVAAHISARNVKEGTNVRTLPACLSTFRIGNDGKLEYVRKYEVDVGENLMFWMGMVTL
jgi:6-phosphogluconolactonase (cycloisomerase 2 family)